MGEYRMGEGEGMTDYLTEFLKGFTLTQAEVEQLSSEIDVRTYKQGTILLRQGDVSKECYFVLQGCLRQFAIDEAGEENTYNFYTEKQTAINYKSYTQRMPSEYSIECVEDSVLIVGDFINEDVMFQKYPKLIEITRGFMEEDLANIQDNNARFISASPQECYLNLLDTRPNLIDRVPQHQLASLLGMKPESLSRIKRRLNL